MGVRGSGLSQPLRVELTQLFPWQTAQIARCRFLVGEAGRRSGKTTLAERDVAEVALGIGRTTKRGRGGRAAWYGPNMSYIRDTYERLLATLGPAIERSSRETWEIFLKNGGKVELWSLHASIDPGRGRSYDLVVFEEAGLIPQLAQCWRATVRPTLISTGGRALFIGTPTPVRSDFTDIAENARALELEGSTEWGFFRVGSSSNPLIDPAEIELARAEAERNGTMPLFLAEYEGIPCDDGSNPIGVAAIERAGEAASLRPVAAVGIDLASSQDYTVITACDKLGGWTHCVKLEHAPWPEQKLKIAKWLRTHATDDGVNLTVPVAVDGTGVGGPVVEDLWALGLNVKKVIFTENRRAELLSELASAIQHRELRIPRREDAPWLIRELESLGVSKTPSGRVRWQVPAGRHDDGLMSLALLQSVAKAIEPPKQPKRAVSVDRDRGVHSTKDDYIGTVSWYDDAFVSPNWQGTDNYEVIG